jgi:hypothetical protein
MEVHAHPHIFDPDKHRGRKKWTHYLWEFLMLFLAVFCGFLAENIREHQVEKNRAREYAKALYEDIVNDTANLRTTILEATNLIACQDTLTDLLKKMSIEKKKIPTAALYYYADKSMGSTFFSIKTSTLSQLKNSGSLRLLKNPELIRLITNYDQAINNQLLRTDYDLNSLSEIVRSIKQIFSYAVNKQLDSLIKKHPLSKDSMLNLDLPLLNRDEKSFSDLFYALSQFQSNLKLRTGTYYYDPLMIGINLIAALKKEYHLE